jgi:hypothetical protein
MIFDTFDVVKRCQVKSTCKLGYGKNYTVQTNLLSYIPYQHKVSFETEWLTVTSSDSSVNSLYKLETDVEQKDTALISITDASAEAIRLRDYHKTQRMVYKFRGRTGLMSLELGQQIVLYHHRFGLSSGKTGQIISLSPNWSTQTIDVEVIV